jgi:hypothetical protein
VIPYEFADEELKCLAKLLRKNESSLDSRLDRLHCFLEDTVYRMMTIEEAEEFYGIKD